MESTNIYADSSSRFPLTVRTCTQKERYNVTDTNDHGSMGNGMSTSAHADGTLDHRAYRTPRVTAIVGCIGSNSIGCICCGFVEKERKLGERLWKKTVEHVD